jgi:hypothetical protein
LNTQRSPIAQNLGGIAVFEKDLNSALSKVN